MTLDVSEKQFENDIESTLLAGMVPVTNDLPPEEMATFSPRYIRLQCASCRKVLGWRERRDDTSWILALCDDCYETGER